MKKKNTFTNQNIECIGFKEFIHIKLENQIKIELV